MNVDCGAEKRAHAFLSGREPCITMANVNQRDTMGQQTEQIVRRKLSDEVFARLKAMITSGELQPGDEMPSERELMERFGVGRPAIREAMQALAGMGLVVISHGER